MNTAYSRSELEAMTRDELRPISRMLALDRQSPIDMTWLWNARRELQIAFILGEPLANGFPRKWKPTVPEAIVPQAAGAGSLHEEIKRLEAKIDALTQVLIAWIIPRK